MTHPHETRHEHPMNAIKMMTCPKFKKLCFGTSWNPSKNSDCNEDQPEDTNKRDVTSGHTIMVETWISKQ